MNRDYLIKKAKEIKEYENNPRNNDNAVQYVARSIQDFGFKIPIIIDKNNIIVAGHTRYKAAKELRKRKMTNDSARGYIVLTLKTLGYKEEEIDKILNELHLQFDTMTEYEAEQYYYSGAWKDE